NAGKFSWKAIYSGDANNEKAESPCNEILVEIGSASSRETELNNETKKTKAAEGTKLSAAIGDKVFYHAKLSGAANGPLNEATIEYAFYSGESCSGTPTSETPIPNTFTSPGPIPQSNANTFENAGKFSWKAIYSGDANNEKAESPCNEILVVGKNSPTLSTELNNEPKNPKAAPTPRSCDPIGDKVFDTAKLTGAANGP